MIKKDKKFETVSADAFKQANGTYVFPFEVFDKTPGGSNLGRIEWHLEAFPGKKTRGRFYIEKLHVWASQTYDPRYKGKVFEIPIFTEALTRSMHDQNSFFSHVWRVIVCEVHKVAMMSAYPANHHSSLVVEGGSSIGNHIEFK